MRLSNILQSIYAQYHTPGYLSSDPLLCVRRYRRPEDLEIAGLIASSLAYGRVEQIIRSVDRVFAACGDDIRAFTLQTDFAGKVAALSGVKHRFNTHRDIALLFEAAARILRRFGTLEACFRPERSRRNRGPLARDLLHGFVTRLKESVAEATDAASPGFGYLLPSPLAGSACKRLNMYLRWMIRSDDGIDLGVWKKCDASILVMPVDAHIARVAKQLDLTGRASADWVMAEQITARLKKIEPLDPVKYDFSLCRYGMTLFREGSISVTAA